MCIVKLGGKYLIWSDVVDAPVMMGMTLEELREHIREEEGRRGLEAFEQRLARVEAKGTSSFRDENAVDTVWLNRAGANETCMTVAQLIAHFVTNEDPEASPPRGLNEPPTYEGATK